MQAAMSGMGSLAGYSFTQLTPYAAPVSSSSSGASTVASVHQHLQQQQQPGALASTSANVLPADITIKNESGGCSSVTSLQSESVKDASLYDAYTNSENHEIEACTSSMRSSASPRSQEEHVLLGPFPGDTYDVLEQEKKKLERKRARNRLAATKCRQKKLQKINDLEKQIGEEKIRGSRLNEDLKLLEGSIAQLRQLLRDHHNNGCSVPTKVIQA